MPFFRIRVSGCALQRCDTVSLAIQTIADLIAPSRPASFLPERRRLPRPAVWPNLHYSQVQAAGNGSPAYQFAKRGLDVVGSVVLIALLSPVLLLAYIALWIAGGGSPIFTQKRVGQCGRLFTLYKFRTMRSNAEATRGEVPNEQVGPVFKNRRDPRVTRLGRLLRRLSIDELPQLFNVLMGDMSLVGPRPPIEAEVLRYEPWQLRRLAVKPGLTCLWQVSGRCEIGFDQWVRMDLWYVDHQCLHVDLFLLLKTPLAVLSCRGAY
jgi:lipopolysaccharide/colanic/teichoic acid biosynthesis glycosyltransferase